MSENATTGNRDPLHDPTRYPVDYIKSNAFRVIHVDGVFGGVTPRGLISMNLFSERPPLPKHSVYSLQDGRVGDELRDERVVREAFVREVEIGIMVDKDLAKALVNWLTERIAVLDKAHGASESSSAPTGEK